MSWVLDLDGVVWRGNKIIQGSVEAVERLYKLGESVYFVTNNSMLTPSEYVSKMSSFGIAIEQKQMFTSAMAAASMLDQSAKVYVIGGGNGIREAVEKRGIRVVEDSASANAVVLGWNPGITFEMITNAMRAIRSGARYIATNADPTYPNPEGLLPGTGCFAAAVAVASGVEPVYAGKPHSPIASMIRPLLSGNDFMIGDRISTDGRFAKILGAHFGLVLTGVNESYSDSDIVQSTVAADLGSLVRIYEEHGYLPVGNFSG